MCMAELSSPEVQTAAARSKAPIITGSRPEDFLTELAWRFLIFASAAAVLLFSVYCLSHGITVVFMHLYYFPIVLLAYRYRYRGLAPASLLAITYVGLVYFYDVGQTQVIIEAWYRFIVFIGIAAVVAYLSERLAVAQKATRKAAEVKERYISLAPAIVLALDAHGAITLLNEQGCIILGYRFEDVIGKPWFDLFIPEKDRDHIREVFRQLMAGKVEPHRVVDNPVLTRSGAEKIIRWHNTVIHDETGAISGTIGFGEDVTERKRAEEALRESEKRYRDMFELNSAVMFIVDPENGRILDANSSACRYYGYNRDEITGMIITDINIADASITKRNMSYALKVQGAVFSFQHRKKNGEIRDVEVFSAPITLGGHRLLHSIIQDVTERRQAEEALKESEQKFRDIFNNTTDAIQIHGIGDDGKPGKFTDVNDVACRMLGYTRDELLAKTPLDITMDYHNPFLEKIFEEQQTTGSARFETEHRKKDGTVIPVEVNTHIVTILEKKVILAVVRDITERKRAEEALQKASKKISMLSSITRHDIRNQLTALRAYIEILKESVKDAELLTFITKEDRIAEAIGRQIEFTKYYQDIGVSAPKWQGIPELILSAKTPLPELKGIEVTVDIPPVQVYADELIEKVFFNLMENSLRHGEHVTRIRFSFRETPDGAIITYEDDGVGISKEDKTHLFHKGFGKNTGLGMFLSQEILAITGMTIRETGEPGKGVRFEITVPKGMYRFPGGSQDSS